MRSHFAAFALAAAALLSAGCPAVPQDGGGGGIPSSTTLRVTNGGLSPVRVALDRASSAGSGQGANPTITDLTEVLQPGESTSLDISGIRSSGAFNAYVVPAEAGATLLGPFGCQVDWTCGSDAPARLIWSGESVLCTGVETALLELVNLSDETAYLLVDDEQPALPLLPLAPGESRFASFESRLSDVLVQAVVNDAVLGQTVVAFTRCARLRSCEVARVAYDGNALSCD